MINNTKDIAKTRGQKLVNRLIKKTGGKWKLRVWENLGWHFHAECGSIQVNQSGIRKYWTLMSDDITHAGGGCTLWSLDDKVFPYRGVPECFSTPEEAVLAQLQEAKKVVLNLLDVVDKNCQKHTKLTIEI